MDNVQVLIGTSIFIDGLLGFMISSTFFTDIYLIDSSRIGFQWITFDIISPKSLKVSMPLYLYQKEICEDSNETICDYIQILNIIGLVFSSFIILSLISIALGLLHYILALLVRTKRFKALSYSHLISAPLYFSSSLVYLITTYKISTKALPGFYIIVITNFLSVFQLFFYLYIKKFKNWGLEILKYNVIDEPKIEEDSRISLESERMKPDDIKNHIQKNFNKNIKFGKELEVKEKSFVEETELATRIHNNQIKALEEEYSKKNFEIRRKLVEEYEDKIEKAKIEGYNQGTLKSKETKENYEGNLKETEKKYFEKGYSQAKFDVEAEFLTKIKNLETQKKNFEDFEQIKEKYEDLVKSSDEYRLKNSKDNEEIIKNYEHEKTKIENKLKLAEEKITQLEANEKIFNAENNKKAKIIEDNKMKILKLEDEKKKLIAENELKQSIQENRVLEIQKEKVLQSEIESLKTKNNKILAENERLSSQIQGLNEETKKLSDSLTSSLNENSLCSKTIANQQQKILESDSKILSLEKQVLAVNSSKTEKESELTQEIFKSQALIETQKNALFQLENEKKALSDQIHSLSKVKKEYEQKLETYEKDSKKTQENFESQLKETKNTMQELEKQLSLASSESNSLASKNKQTEQELSNLFTKIVEKERIISDSQKTLASVIMENSSFQSKINDQEEELKSLSTKLKITELEKQEISENLSKLLMENNSLKIKLESLENS